MIQENQDDTDQVYLNRLTFLVRHFENERRERFYPFYLIFKGDTRHRRFEEALSIGKYFLDHVFLNTADDERFFKVLKRRMESFRTRAADYRHYARKTPIPMQDYLKVIYDLRQRP